MSRGRVATALAALLLPTPLHAETLQEAIALAYRTNPVLQGQRLTQQALDETYVQAGAGLRPTASFAGSALYERQPNNSLQSGQGTAAGNIGQGAITVTQPLYTGGRTTWALRQADANVAAGREALRGVEEQVIAAVVTAYADVLQAQDGVAIRQADQQTLERQVAESSAKFALGQVTRTDVAQAEAQRDAALAAVAAATAQVEVAKAEYVSAVGLPPGALLQPGALPGLPPTVDQAFDLAEGANPTLQQSREQARAAGAAVGVAKADFLPTVGLVGTYGYIGPVAPLVARDYGQDVSAGVSVTMPLLTGGVNASALRRAKAERGAAEQAVESARRSAVQAVATAWNQLLSARAGVSAGQAQVAAAGVALKGMQAEYGFGLRTTLDVLIVDENLRAAQLALAQSRHDVTLAEAAVLEADGRLTAAATTPDQPLYDPLRHFDEIRGKAMMPWEPLVREIDTLGGPG